MSHVANLMADVVEVAGTENGDLAAAGLVQASESAQESSLSRAIVTEDCIELAACKFGRDAPQSGEAAKLLDQVGDGDDRRLFGQSLRF